MASTMEPQAPTEAAQLSDYCKLSESLLRPTGLQPIKTAVAKHAQHSSFTEQDLLAAAAAFHAASFDPTTYADNQRPPSSNGTALDPTPMGTGITPRLADQAASLQAMLLGSGGTSHGAHTQSYSELITTGQPASLHAPPAIYSPPAHPHLTHAYPPLPNPRFLPPASPPMMHPNLHPAFPLPPVSSPLMTPEEYYYHYAQHYLPQHREPYYDKANNYSSYSTGSQGNPAYYSHATPAPGGPPSGSSYGSPPMTRLPSLPPVSALHGLSPAEYTLLQGMHQANSRDLLDSAAAQMLCSRGSPGAHGIPGPPMCFPAHLEGSPEAAASPSGYETSTMIQRKDTNPHSTDSVTPVTTVRTRPQRAAATRALKRTSAALADDASEGEVEDDGGAKKRSSRFRGVTKHRRSGRWEAHIWIKEIGRQVYLGGYEQEEHAAEAYDVAALKCKGRKVKTNFELNRYTDLLTCMDSISLEELIMAVRRQSQGFSRGSSSFRGVTAHPSGRWESRIGIPGSKHIYLGLYENEKDAAQSYDRALVRLRGTGAATNFGLSDYRVELAEYHQMQQAVLLGDKRMDAIMQSGPEFEKWIKMGAHAFPFMAEMLAASGVVLGEPPAYVQTTSGSQVSADHEPLEGFNSQMNGLSEPVDELNDPMSGLNNSDMNNGNDQAHDAACQMMLNEMLQGGGLTAQLAMICDEQGDGKCATPQDGTKLQAFVPQGMNAHSAEASEGIKARSPSWCAQVVAQVEAAAAADGCVVQAELAAAEKNMVACAHVAAVTNIGSPCSVPAATPPSDDCLSGLQLSC